MCTENHMLGDITAAKEIYIACGYTDMRKSIDGLAALVQEQFQMSPFQPALYLFCGRRRDRIKVLLWEGDGFVLLYKRLENGVFQWPRSEAECKPVTWQQFRWLLEGLKLEQKKVIKPASPSEIC
ncbi:MAG: IS66 family insertion sequence element accessory protein TnpB [Lacrimispora sphenoides]